MDKKNGKVSVVTSPGKAETSAKKRSFWHIDREMLPYKLHFLLFVGGAGAVFPFQSAFGITVLGLTAGNIAACFTALQVTIFLLKPGIGYLADYFNRLKAVIMALAVLQTLFAFLLIIIPNTGMPGIHEMQLADSSQNMTYNCQLCSNTENFSLAIPKLYINEENFTQVLSYFNNNASENILINCSDYLKRNNSNHSQEIWKITSNSSSALSILFENYPDSDDFYVSQVFFYFMHFKKSSSSFVCLLREEVNVLHLNVLSDDLNQYCYAISNETSMAFKEYFINSPFTILNCSDMDVRNSTKIKDEQSLSIENFKTYQFWAFAACLVLTCTFGSSHFTISDTACYESIQGNDYGRQRVWGAISWGIMAPFAGYLNDYTEGYFASWCVMACLYALQIWNLSWMKLVKPDFSQNMLKDLKTIFSSTEFLYFSTGVLLNGMFTGIIWYYLVWFLVSIGGNKLIIGLVHAFQCFFGEVPAMYFSGWLIKKLGHFNLVSLALISHGIRFFIYSYLHNPWLILPIECLHGFTFGSFYAAMTSYGKLNSKPGTEATTQSILCIIYEALGCGLGCFVTGICLEYFGGHTTFFYASFVCVIATVINVIFTLAVRCRKGAVDVTISVPVAIRY